MKSLLQELTDQPQEKPPEQRLASLLESLKDYCVVAGEFDLYCQKAFGILQDSGFRQAREFVVGAHHELRARARKLEQEEIADEENADER